jgi:chemotaxis protein CheD
MALVDASNKPAFKQPEALPGFSHINRYWDKRQSVYAAKILPGEFYVSKTGEMIVTVLGSCVSACIRDKKLGIGGMNHFMLPVQKENMVEGVSTLSMEARYGNWAMEYLINEILKNGGNKNNLEVKIFGGGRVLQNMNMIDVGGRNIEFVRQYLLDEGLQIIAQDVGDVFPRKVLYFPDTGSVKIRKLRSLANNTVEARERRYAEQLVEKPKGGDIELF